MKRCSICEKIKTNNHFGKLAKNKDGLRSQCKECRKKEYLLDSERIKEKRKSYYRKNKEKVLMETKKYKQENADWYREYNKNYYKYNKSRIKENVKRYRNTRMKSDVNFRLIGRYRTRIYKALKGIAKSKNTQELIGCSIDKLKSHLEQKFERDMSWENYGKWHVDHIIPCAKFDFRDFEQQKECFHYTNLQPMWAEDNLKKLDKIC